MTTQNTLGASHHNTTVPRCAHCGTPLRPVYPIDYWDEMNQRWVLLHNTCKECDRKEHSSMREE